MKIKDGYKLRQVAGEDIVVPLADKTKKANGIFRLNKQASELFNVFSSDSTAQDAIDFLTENYGISTEQAESDVNDFIDMLRKFDMLDE
ncbi:MAG: PqqD family protein [Ruminococcus sp.]|nr:PqqD family protein [Ruminococcus sp.]